MTKGRTEVAIPLPACGAEVRRDRATAVQTEVRRGLSIHSANRAGRYY